MKTIYVNFLFVLLTIVSCGDHGVSSPTANLPLGLFDIEKVYDVGNAADASDIRASIRFSGGTTAAKLGEVRFVVSKVSSTLSTTTAENLKSGTFVVVTVSEDPAQSSITLKGTGALKDADGDAITNGSYDAYVVTFQSGKAVQITDPVRFTLADQPVFAGNYIGTWEDLGPPGPATFPMSLIIKTDYTGQMFYANANFKPFGSGSQDATTSMTVSGNLTVSFVLNQSIPGYKAGCAAQKTLTGRFVNDINLVLDTFTWADCDGTREVKLSFTRQ